MHLSLSDLHILTAWGIAVREHDGRRFDADEEALLLRLEKLRARELQRKAVR